MKKLNLELIILIMVMLNISVSVFGNKVLVLELMSRHNAEQWFNDQKDIDFCHAVEWGDTWKMEKMLKEGININRQGKQGVTFLAYAYLKNNKKSYQFLLENGADPNLVFKTEEKIEGNITPLEFEYSTLTMAAEDKDDPFYLALGLKYSGNPNIVVNDVHILHNAIGAESLTNVQLLVAAGANLTNISSENNGGDFLNNAVSGGQYEIVYYLLQKGANPELRRDDIIFTMVNMYTRIDQRENKAKVQKFLETKGFDFSDSNFQRIEEELNKKADERVKEISEKIKKREGK